MDEEKNYHYEYSKILMHRLKKNYSVDSVRYVFGNVYKDDYIFNNPEDKEAVFAYLNKIYESSK
jgi:hypothetical protein